MAYLVSQYPAANHTFILREILGLRRLGLDIQVASIRPPDRPYAQLSADEQREQQATFYVKPRAIRALAANLRMLFAQPLSYSRSFVYAIRLARWNARAALRNLFYFAEAAVVAGWMRRRKLSRIHTHFTSTVGLLAQRLSPMCISVTMHGPAEFADPDGFYLREKIRAFQLLCTISDYGRKQLMLFSDDAQWDKIRVVRLGVDPALYAPREFRASPSCWEILFVGRLASVKAPQVLFAAFERLVRENRPLRLRLVGDGPERGALEDSVRQRGLSKKVIFEGWQNADRVRAFYEQADIFCLPSLAEGIPVVLMEAMAMEIPCVAAEVGGVPELISDEIDGLLVPPSNEEAVFTALSRLLDDSGLRHRLGQSGRQRVLEDYDLGRNTERLAAIFREFSGCSPGAES